MGIGSGPVMEPERGNKLIEQVANGMIVVDRTGERIGKVTHIAMGDPDALTGEGNRPQRFELVPGLGYTVYGVEREPEVPDAARPKLMHYGFIKIAGGGLFHKDHYARADQVASVEGDTVTLSVTSHDLIEVSRRP